MRRTVIGAVLAAVSTTIALAGPAQAEDRYTVTATTSATNVDVGQAVTIRGHVSPGARHEYAIVQRFTGSGWTKVTRDKINKYGNYRASVTVTAPGDNVYRVLKRHSHGHLRGVSPSFTVAGWRWRSVTDLPAAAPSVNAVVVPSLTVRELVFTPALKLSGTGAASYTLGGLCTKFDGHVAMLADSADAVPGAGQIGLDAAGGAPNDYNLVVDQTLNRGEYPAHVFLGATQMATADHIELASATGAGNNVAWGEPKVYCKS